MPTKTAKKTKKPVKKVVKKTNPKPSANGHTPRKRKEGLRTPQIKILHYLNSLKGSGGVLEYKICEKARVDPAWFREAMFGRISREEKGPTYKKLTPGGLKFMKERDYRPLLDYGFVKGVVDVEGQRSWTITPQGKKAFSDLPKEVVDKAVKKK